MNNATKAALFGGALFCAGMADAKDTYRIHGPASYASTSGYALDDAVMQPFLDALRNPYNFSHLFSYVDTSIEIGFLWATLDSNELANADCLISPWILDTDLTGSELNAAWRHFREGGDLLLFNDDSSHDAIGAYLGIPTVDGVSSSTFNDTTFPFNGPFGTTSSVELGGIIGHLEAAHVLGTGGQVLALNGAGEIIVAFWEENAYTPGSGRMIIVSDVNTITTRATYAPLDDNGRFALNLVAGLIGADGCNIADCDSNGVLNVDDVECFVDTFLGGCN
ncbi:MAG: hypothetical protein DHS20C14_11580 [Phycisphaeraceae bacterium]|nr:MAG: hypothetical protein DHS20C14_11580 [Phycisphaeraceae bacterium]